jgi:cellulose synthase/poly-beta-1,6-N-acetylglucosamine synthase-like glycosyltransferase
MVKFSFVVPTKNNFNDFKRLANSIKIQKLRNYEVVVIDASYDDSIENFCKKQKFRFIKQTNKKGLSNARNMGWKASKGEWIIWIDADHVLDKNFLENLDNFIKNNNFKCIAPLQVFIGRKFLQKIIKTELDTNMSNLKNRLPTVVKKNVLKKIGGWDESIKFFGEDRVFNKKIREKYEVGVSEKSIVYVEPTDNIIDLFRQAKSYGKSMSEFLKHNFSLKLSGSLVIHASIFPLILLFFFIPQLWFPALVCFFIIVFEAMFYLVKSKSFYSIFVPLIKIFRSSVEAPLILFYTLRRILKNMFNLTKKLLRIF